MLTFIMEAHGGETASLVAENYVHDRIREAAQEQHVTAAIRMARRNRHLAEAILLMERHLEDTLAPGRAWPPQSGFPPGSSRGFSRAGSAGRRGNSISTSGSTAPPACSGRQA